MLVAYVDGSYNPATKKPGWGVVVLQEGIPIWVAWGSLDKYTESRQIGGELKAAMIAVQFAYSWGESLTIYHDYNGIEYLATGVWKANPQNMLTTLYQKWMQKMALKVDYQFVKVKGHSGDRWNDYADWLSKKGCGL